MTIVQDEARLKALLVDKVDGCLSRWRESWSSAGIAERERLVCAGGAGHPVVERLLEERPGEIGCWMLGWIEEVSK